MEVEDAPDPTVFRDPETLQQQKPIKRLLTPFIPKTVPPLPTAEERKELPVHTKNLFARLFFTWLIPMLNKGYKRTLLQQDLWYLNERESVDQNYESLQRNIDAIVDAHLRKNPDAKTWPKYALMKAIFKTYKYDLAASVLFRLVCVTSLAMTPYLSRFLIAFIEEKSFIPSTSTSKGVGYSIGLTAMMIFSTLLNNQSFLYSKFVGAKAKVAINKALLEKSMVIDQEARYKFPNGKIVSLMNADLERIDLAMGFFPLLCGFPVPMIIGIALLIHNIGVSALTGVAVVLLMLFLMGAPSAKIFEIRQKANKFTDERIGLTREILMNMRMVKFYSWEDAYDKIVSLARGNEVHYVLIIQMFFAVIFSVAFSTASLVSMVSFLVLHKVGSGSPATIFSSLSLFTILSNSLVNVPVALSFSIDALTATKRISEFLQASTINEKELLEYFDNDIIDDDETAIQIANATFKWDIFKEIESPEKSSDEESTKEGLNLQESFDPQDDHQASFDSDKQQPKTSSIVEKGKVEDPTRELIHEYSTIFSNINLKINKGEFIVITGPIGCGKTSLLAAIFGLMHKTSGSIGVNGSMGYTGEPWVQNTTARENITFGSQFDEAFYKSVVSSCSLAADFDSFSAGDFTEIGERGVTLSGGQKARLNLARAIYSNKDIYLLDDILSAVDANVGSRITEECLLGLIKNKTRLLATHQLPLIAKADRIVFISNDRTLDFGTEEELRSRNQEFVDLMEFNHRSEEGEKEEAGGEDSGLSKAVTHKSFDQRAVDADDGILVADEERAVNSIPLDIYKKYIRAGQGMFGIFALPLLITAIVGTVFFSLFSNVWLSFWTSNKFKGLSEGDYMGLYILFTFLSVIFAVCEFSLFGYMVVKASKVLNLKAMKMIIHTPMSFIDTTPLGRILNRFSTDTTVLDNEIDASLKLFVHFAASAIGIIILAIVYIPYFAIAIPVLSIMFVVVTNYYQASAREVKRLEAINRSFILNNFNEVLNGMTTIKAYNQKDSFVKKNSRFSDSLNEVYLVVIANQRWVAVHLDTLAAFVVLIVTLLAVTGQFKLNASSVGLLVSYMIEFSMLLSEVLVFYAELENNMNSVERVCHYAYDVDQEKPFRIPETAPDPNWPEHGTVEFKEVCLRYREKLPLIFNNLSFKVEGGSKIGICGRTGAGKSSLMTALYRTVELESGSIEIDGVDISKLGLFDLRSKLSIIPQDPVLFKGTIRSNLDPFGQSDDSKLWDALRRSGVFHNMDYEKVRKETKKDTEELNKFHLDSVVSEDGANFSLGEKQLIALARALVRDTKILVMDEATSSVDYETDALIQKTISVEFSHCTILCIAHRLRTILKSDKIIVLEQGTLEEYGTPLELFNNNKIFKEMCDSSGIDTSDF